MARVAVQSNSDKGISQKLVFRSQGPFVIEHVLGADAYRVRRFGKDNGALQKFHADDLYLLPKTILPCEHLDTPDMRYLNTDHPPLHHPLSDIYDIEGYNIAWYDDKPPSRPPDFLHDSSIVVTSPQSARL